MGFVGLGDQGAPIAERILKAGYPLWVWARRPGVVDPLVEAGARAAADLAELGGACDAVGICVVDDAGVREVSGAVLPALRPGSVLMILATVHPDTCRELAERAAERGVDVLDTPVSGGGGAAREGTLAVMAGGEAATLERWRPLIDSFAGQLVHLGGVGAGQLGKLVNNAMFAANLETARRAVAAGEALGLDRAELDRLLSGSSGRSFAHQVLSGLPDLAMFAGGAQLLRKDARLLREVTGARGVDAGDLVDQAEAFLGRVEAAADPVSSGGS